MGSMKTASVTSVLTDIPYDEVNRPSSGLRSFDKGSADQATFDLETFTDECARVSKGFVHIWCGTKQIQKIIESFERNKLKNIRVFTWCKTNPSPINSKKGYLSALEVSVVAKHPKAKFYNSYQKNYFVGPSVRNKAHPTQKSLALWETCLGNIAGPGDVVFDPCAGSLITAATATKLNIGYICSDISLDFLEKGKEFFSLSAPIIKK